MGAQDSFPVISPPSKQNPACLWNISELWKVIESCIWNASCFFFSPLAFIVGVLWMSGRTESLSLKELGRTGPLGEDKVIAPGLALTPRSENVSVVWQIRDEMFLLLSSLYQGVWLFFFFNFVEQYNKLRIPQSCLILHTLNDHQAIPVDA